MTNKWIWNLNIGIMNHLVMMMQRRNDEIFYRFWLHSDFIGKNLWFFLALTMHSHQWKWIIKRKLSTIFILHIKWTHLATSIYMLIRTMYIKTEHNKMKYLFCSIITSLVTSIFSDCIVFENGIFLFRIVIHDSICYLWNYTFELIFLFFTFIFLQNLFDVKSWSNRNIFKYITIGTSRATS